MTGTHRLARVGLPPPRRRGGSGASLRHRKSLLKVKCRSAADGAVSVEIDTSIAKTLHPDDDHRYTIEAEVVDQSRRTIVGTGDGARRPSALPSERVGRPRLLPRWATPSKRTSPPVASMANQSKAPASCALLKIKLWPCARPQASRD